MKGVLGKKMPSKVEKLPVKIHNNKKIFLKDNFHLPDRFFHKKL